jgi:hydrogenase maturation protease
MARGALVIGIGNPDRGDDGAGRAVARALRGELPSDIEIVETDGEATTLVALLGRSRKVFLIDACASVAPPGTIRRFDAGIRDLPRLGFSMSTHGAGVGEAIELARALGDLPPTCILYTIAGTSFETGVPLSSGVAAAVRDVAARLADELRELPLAPREMACTKPT